MSVGGRSRGRGDGGGGGGGVFLPWFLWEWEEVGLCVMK